MRQVRRFGVIVAAIVILVAGLLPIANVRAQEQAGQAIQVSPVLVELNADAGQSYTIKLTLTNVSSGDIVLSPEVNDFKAKDESGTPEIIFNDEDSTSYSLKSWVSGVSRLYLKSKESKTVEATITVPENAEPGGHYGIIRFSGVAPELESTGVALSASVGVLVLGRVSGEVDEKLSVEQFYIEQNGNQRSWVEKAPFKIVERIGNSGSVHLKPSGEVTIKNIFGGIVGSLPVNEEGKNILPDSIRRFEQDYTGEGFMLGRYTAQMDLAYGTTGQVLQASTNFWVIPYKLIAICLLGLILLIVVGRKLIKGYNKRIIERASRK